MEDGLAAASKWAVFIIDAMALVVIVVGTMEAFVTGLWAMFATSATIAEGRRVWLRYGHWLVAGLTFLLAADIIESTVAPTWDEIGRLAAIAAIRTFLNYFLERDLRDESPAEVSHIT